MQGCSEAVVLVPSDHGGMCTLTNEDIIALRCITTNAMNTNNVFIFVFGVLSHGFLTHGCNVRRQTQKHTKGIGVVIHPLHELSRRAKGTQVEISSNCFKFATVHCPFKPKEPCAC